MSNEDQSIESTRVNLKGPIHDDLVDFSMLTIDDVGDRRTCVWVSSSLGIPPGAMIVIMHRVGLLQYDPSWNRVLAFDFHRNDYVPYTSNRRASWWNRVWVDVSNWFNTEYGK